MMEEQKSSFFSLFFCICRNYIIAADAFTPSSCLRSKAYDLDSCTHVSTYERPYNNIRYIYNYYYISS